MDEALKLLSIKFNTTPKEILEVLELKFKNIGNLNNENENIILEDFNNDSETISFDEFGSLRFEDILTKEKIILEQGNVEKVAPVLLLEGIRDDRLVQEGGGLFELELETSPSKLLGAGSVDQDNANVAENVGILLPMLLL